MSVITHHPPRVAINPPGGSVRVGTGPGSITIGNARRLTVAAPGGRVTIAAAPRVVTVGSRQGIAGPPGPGSEIEIYTAAVSLGGHRAVALDDAGELVYADAVLGIPAIGVIRDAFAAGAEVAVYRAGRVGGFTGLTPAAPYYIASTGLLSLTAPAEGVLQPVGVAASATELLVDPDYPTFI